MAHICEDGSTVPGDDPIAARGRAAVVRQRELDEADVVEHEGQQCHETADILELLNGDSSS